MNILNTNEETGKANYHYTENRYNRDIPGQKFDYETYNKVELSKAKPKGGILNTNAESGYDTWNWEKKYKQKEPPKDYFEQYQQGKKTSGGILKTNAESGAWNFASREYNDPDAIKRFNMRLQNNNNNYNYDNNFNNNLNYNNNQPINSFNQIPKEVIERSDLESQNYQQNNFSNKIPDVQKIETSESFIVERGVKKKITKVVKYMSNGEVETEILKTNL